MHGNKHNNANHQTMNWFFLEMKNHYQTIQILSKPIAQEINSALTSIKGFGQYLPDIIPLERERLESVYAYCRELQIEACLMIDKEWPEIDEFDTALSSLRQLYSSVNKMLEMLSTIDKLVLETPYEVRLKHSENFLIIATEVSRSARILQELLTLCHDGVQVFYQYKQEKQSLDQNSPMSRREGKR